MRLLHRRIDTKTKEGAVKIEPQDAEDMWHLYNLVSEGDRLTSSSFRKVQSETSTGSTSSTRRALTLTILVRAIAFDGLAAEMRASGPVVSESAHVRAGAFHTMQLAVNRALTLHKAEWDAAHLARLDLALDPAADADVAAVVMEDGLAHILALTRSLTITRCRVQVAVPRKGAAALHGRSRALEKFFAEVFRACLCHIDFDNVKVVLVASPGYVKDEFYRYMVKEASRLDEKALLRNQTKFVLCHASSGHRHAIHQVLSRDDVQARLARVGAVQQVVAIKRFRQMLQNDPLRAAYGPKHVMHCAEMGAIEILLVTDTLLRAADANTRRRYVDLVENAKGNGANVLMLSTQHVSGEMLDQMSGIAAILRFPLPELDDIE